METRKGANSQLLPSRCKRPGADSGEFLQLPRKLIQNKKKELSGKFLLLLKV